MIDKELYHHGILGQRWGIRRFQKKDGTLTSAGKKRRNYENDNPDEDTNISKTKKSNSSGKSKKISEMSDEEIQKRIDRINLERKYESLVKGDGKKEVSKGKQFVSDVLKTSGKNIATQTTTYFMGKAVNKAIESITGEKNAINPKKGQKDK